MPAQNSSQNTLPVHINLIDVEKIYPSSGTVLTQLNLEIQTKDFVVILGPSGSGKSTLLRLIAGLEKPSQGQIKIAENIKLKKSFVFQEAHLMPWRNVLENVALPLELNGIDKTTRLAKAQEALNLVKLADAADLLPFELSGGMKMRTSLARALVNEPQLLLLDEPFAALDEQSRFKLSEELRELWLQKNMTIIFVTHSIQEACFLGNRIVTLSKKPARIENDFTLNLPIGRTRELRNSSQFNDEVRRVYQILNNSEILKV